MEESLLHAIVGSNMLEDIPSKLLVELPSDEAVADGADTNDAGDGDQNALHVIPDGQVLNGILGDQDIDSLADLIDLDGCIDHQSEVCDTNTNDLNCVLDTEGIPDQNKLVEEAEDEECEESRDRLELRLDLLVRVVRRLVGVLQTLIELGEDISGMEVSSDSRPGECEMTERKPTLRKQCTG